MQGARCSMCSSDQCDHCGFDIPPSWERCPHCALPGLFPNVRAAEREEEVDALESRYRTAVEDAAKRGCHDRVQEFEVALARSVAVIARPMNEVERLATSQKELYSTHYKLAQAEVRLPSGEKWDVLRQVADSPLFPDYKEHIRFAALSLDGLGVTNYGGCSLILKKHMIAHRASVFEENSVVFLDHHDIRAARLHELPRGFRATWDQRAKLCLAKLADRIKIDTQPESFGAILLVPGRTTADDEFIEVHIWGPISIHSCERVVVLRKKRQPSKGRLAILRGRLARFDIELEERECTP